MSRPHPSRLQHVTSRQNSLIKMFRAVAQSQGISEEGYVLLEGPHLVEEAIRSGYSLNAVLFREQNASFISELLPKIPVTAQTVVAPDDVFRSAVSTETPQGVVALIEPKAFTLDEFFVGKSPYVVVAAGLQDPGNLGTIMRTAEAFGACGLLMTENTVSPWNQKSVRASAGSVLRLPTLKIKTTKLIAELKSRGVKMLGTSSHHGKTLPHSDLTGKLALVIGNEGKGLPAAITSAMDMMVSIPQSSNVESLNAAVATAVILYEITRQRGWKTA
jgi:TrmH family RNA methyltransferase